MYLTIKDGERYPLKLGVTLSRRSIRLNSPGSLYALTGSDNQGIEPAFFTAKVARVHEEQQSGDFLTTLTTLTAEKHKVLIKKI
jgi:hypothetical protein